MRSVPLFILAVLSLSAVGCRTHFEIPHEPQPTHRTFGAPYEAVWDATLDALSRMPLSAADRASGIVITEWREGFSDVRFRSRVFSEPEPLAIRYRLTVKLKRRTRGVRVSVFNTEYSAYREIVHEPWPAYSSARFSRGFHHPHTRDWGRTVHRDAFRPTASSTAKEAALLDRIEAVLRARFR